MIKLIVSDMDGTLFNSNQEISPYNLAAIRNAQKNNIKFMIATGRSMELMIPTLEKYNLQCGLILVNGAEIRDENRKILNTIDINSSIIPAISKKLQEMGYMPEYMTNEGTQVCGSEEQMILNMGYRMMCLDRAYVLTLKEAIDKGKNSVFMNVLTRNESVEDMMKKNLVFHKIIVFHLDKEKNKRNRELLRKEFPELSIVSSYPENIEINHKTAQKGYGLEQLIKKMNLSKEEVAVFGDGLNDLSMFELFPNSYAPINAEADVKKRAKEIIPSNNEDGVGKKINEIVYKDRL